MSTNIQRTQIDGLRTSDAATVAAKLSDLFRQHLDVFHPSTVADVFALSEAKVPTSLSADLRAWTTRAAQSLRDMPDNGTRAAWLDELAALPAEHVSSRLREAVMALTPVSGGAVVAQIDAMAATWQSTPASVLELPTKAKAAAAAKAAAKAEKPAKEAKAPRVIKTPRTPKQDVDPRRAEWVREDALARLGASEYAERGLKESIFLGGIRHRCPYKDITDEEIKVTLRKLEREGKIKHTGERWLTR